MNDSNLDSINTILINSIDTTNYQKTNWYESHDLCQQAEEIYKVAVDTVLTIEKRCYQDLNPGDIYTNIDARYSDRCLVAFKILNKKVDRDGCVFHLTQDDGISSFVSIEESNLLEQDNLNCMSAIRSDTLDTYIPAAEIGKRRFVHEELLCKRKDRQLVTSRQYQKWVNDLQIGDSVIIEPVVPSDRDKWGHCTVKEITNTKLVIHDDYSNDDYHFRKTGLHINEDERLVLKPIPVVRKCINCIYSSLHTTPAYWENLAETELICNYPNTNTEEYKEYDRGELDCDWGDDIGDPDLEDIKDCTNYRHYSTIE